MGLKKKIFTDDEVAIFDEALIQKRGEFWHFRMWLEGEGKYARISLKTRNRDAAIDKGKTLFHQIKANQAAGKTYFSLTAEEGVTMYLEQRQKDVDAGLCKARDKNGPFPGLKRGQSLQTKSLDRGRVVIGVGEAAVA